MGCCDVTVADELSYEVSDNRKNLDMRRDEEEETD